MSVLTSDEDLLNSSSLPDLQQYVKMIAIERGFTNETAQDTFMLLAEEMGELAKAMRPMHGVKLAKDSVVRDISNELGDIQLLLLSLSNVIGIDLWEAVVEKERANRARTWS